jgi:hypothetical protein
MIDLFNQPAIVARDKAIKKVSEGSPTWIELAHKTIPLYSENTATGEDLKVFLRERIGDPRHHNVYGAMIMGAVKKGILIGTGEFPTMKLKKSHARRNQLYRINK